MLKSPALHLAQAMPNPRVPPDQGSLTQDPTPNALVRLVACTPLSIRAKLLIAFLGSTLLLAGLALSGLSALEQTNTRTQTLIRDQDRFSFYSELYGALSDLQIIALTASIHPDLTKERTEGFRQDAGILVSDRSRDLTGILGQAMRRFGRRDTAEGAWLWDLRTRVKALFPITAQIRDLRHARDMTHVENIVLHDFTPVVALL